MKLIKTLASTTALAACLGAMPLASAATIAPAGAVKAAPGSITVRAPATGYLPVTCSVTFGGVVSADGATASIKNVAVSGSSWLCGIPEIQNLPWTLTPTSTSTGTISGVQFTIDSSIGSSTCGPSTVNATWSNGENTLTLTNQPLTGRCTIVSLSVEPSPAFTVSP